jgi:hypothetical protein
MITSPTATLPSAAAAPRGSIICTRMRDCACTWWEGGVVGRVSVWRVRDCVHETGGPKGQPL